MTNYHDMRPTPYGMRRWPAHYCGQEHNPKYPCPAPVMEVGGFPVSELDPCKCQGLEHAQDCPRRRAIKSLYNRRPEK